MSSKSYQSDDSLSKASEKKILFQDTRLAYERLSTADLKRRLFFFKLMRYPFFIRLGFGITKIYPLLNWCLRPLIKKTLFKIFVAGETLEEAQITAVKLYEKNILIILDYAIEAKENLPDWEKARQNFKKIVYYASNKKHIPFVSIKLSSMISHKLLTKISKNETKNLEEESLITQSKAYFTEIVQLASEKKVSLLVDAEESWVQGAIDKWTLELAKKYNLNFPTLYFTIQLYRKKGFDNLLQFYSELTAFEAFPAFKIVRGAYIQKETLYADKMNIENEIFPSKKETDESFRKGLQFCLDNLDNCYSILATHNEQDVKYACDFLQKRVNKNNKNIHFSQLYGMRDTTTYQLASEGFSVSKYIPFGSIGDVLPYLLRRATENTSIKKQSSEELELLKIEIKNRKNKLYA